MSGPPKDGGSQHGRFSGLMGDLREKLHDTKLHDAKVQLIHKKSPFPARASRDQGCLS